MNRPRGRIAMKIKIVTVVWGAALVDRLMTLVVRSLMAPGNIPGLASRHEVVYEIYAPPVDVERIRAHPLFTGLQQLVDVQFQPFAISDITAGNPMEHWRVWGWAVEQGRRDDVAVMLVAPDQVFVAGTLTRWADLLDSGKDAVFCTGFQVVLETVAPVIAARFPGDGPIALTTSEFHKLVLEHLHPIMIGMLRGSPRSIPHAEWHLRPVPGQGLVQRVLSSHAYAFRPSRIKLTDNFRPIANFDRVAFEPSGFFGVEPLLKQLGYYLRPQALDDTVLSYYGVWADRFMARINLAEASINHELYLGPRIAEEAFCARRAGADFFVGQLITGRALVRLADRLQASGLTLAAQWLAAAQLHARLRRRIALRGQATVFVPPNDVLDRISSSEADGLLAEGGPGLTNIMRAHVARGHYSLKPGDRLAEALGGEIAMLAGTAWSAAKDGRVRVLRGPIPVDDIDVYAIDGLLTPLALDAPRSGARLRAITHRVAAASASIFARGKTALVTLVQRNARLYEAVLKARERMLRRSRVSKSDSEAVPAALQLYHQALAMRGLAAMRDLNDFHARHVLAQPAASTALSKLLTSLDRAADPAQFLTQATAIDPNFAEAWLEMGYLKRDLGDAAGAMDAFARANVTAPRIAVPLGLPDVKMLATMELAALLLRAGRAEEALATLDSVPSIRFAPWERFLYRARALVALRRPSEALQNFSVALRWSAAEQRLVGNLPRDIEEFHAIAG